MYCLKTTDDQTKSFDTPEELQEAILDAFSEDGMNPIEDVWMVRGDGKRVQLVTEWSVKVRPCRPEGRS